MLCEPNAMELSSLFRPSNDGFSESLENLSQIFNDPLLNELTDKLLNDIDINEFGEFILDEFKQEPQTYSQDAAPTQLPVTNFNAKSASVSSNKLDKPSHATLKALLKSRTPSSCVAPAPELRAESGDLMSRGDDEVGVYLPRHCQKDSKLASLPDLLSEQHKTRNQTEGGNCALKSRLICNLLNKPSVTDTPKSLVTNSGRSCCYGTSSVGCHRANTYNIDTGASVEVSRSDTKPVRRAPHNAIEKRYRASINGRIDELRSILIPFPNGDSKVNKSAVLRQAIDRIKELEAKNEQLQAELQALRSLGKNAPRLGSFSQSPESGVCSFEPSPSCGSFTSFDVGNLTPLSSGTSCGSLTHHGNNESGDSAVSSLGGQSSPDSLGAPSWSIDIETPMQIFEVRDFVTTATPACDTQPSHNNHNGEELVKFPASAANLVTSNGTCGLDLKDASGHSSTTPQLYINGDSTIDGLTTQHLPTVAEFLTADKTTAVNSNNLPQQSNFRSLRKSSNSSLISGKRTADYSTARPAKIRREIFMSSGANVADESAYQLVSTLPSNSSAELQLDRQPRIRNLLYTSDVHMNSDISHEDGRAPRPSFTPNFGGVAARTTLCVVALCLIAFDPFILTGNQRTPNSQNLRFSPARRLLSVFTIISPQEAAEDSHNYWLTWLACVIQWSVAAFLFLRACQKNPSSQKDLDARYLAASESADLHWNKANDALAKCSWSLAEQHLWLCLADLDAPLVTRQYQMDHLANYILFLRDWLAIFLEAAWFLITRTPRWIWTMNVRPWFRRQTNSPVRSKPIALSKRPSSLAEIRLRLLELYLFAMDDGQSDSSCLLTVHPLAWLRLLLSCLCDFTDGAIQAVGQKKRNSVKKQDYALSCRLRPSLVVRHGVTLVLIMSRRGCSRVSRLLARKVLTVVNRLPDDTIWGRWISNPVIRSIFIQRPCDCVCLSQSPVEKGSPRLYQVIQRKLRKLLMTHCLRVLLHRTCPDFYNLGSSLQALLELCSTKHAEYLAAESCGFVFSKHSLCNSDALITKSSKALEKDRWWAQFTAVLWSSLIGAGEDNPGGVQMSTSSESALPTALEEPPAIVLSCPHTGELAKALWITYRAACCNLPPTERHSLAYDASISIKKAFKNICDRCTSVSDHGPLVFVDDMSVPFEVLVWTLIAADTLVNIIFYPFMGSKLFHREFIYPLNVPSDAMKGTMSALWTVRRVSYMLGPERPEWTKLKLDYAGALWAMLAGANPVRTRLSLLQRYQHLPSHRTHYPCSAEPEIQCRLPKRMPTSDKQQPLGTPAFPSSAINKCHLNSADHSSKSGLPIGGKRQEFGLNFYKNGCLLQSPGR